jgi:hypothetical protein
MHAMKVGGGAEVDLLTSTYWTSWIFQMCIIVNVAYV